MFNRVPLPNTASNADSLSDNPGYVYIDVELSYFVSPTHTTYS